MGIWPLYTIPLALGAPQEFGSTEGPPRALWARRTGCRPRPGGRGPPAGLRWGRPAGSTSTAALRTAAGSATWRCSSPWPLSRDGCSGERRIIGFLTEPGSVRPGPGLVGLPSPAPMTPRPALRRRPHSTRNRRRRIRARPFRSRLGARSRSRWHSRICSRPRSSRAAPPQPLVTISLTRRTPRDILGRTPRHILGPARSKAGPDRSLMGAPHGVSTLVATRPTAARCLA